MKRVIVVRRNCHEFANKLWSDMAIYAFAFAMKAKVWNFAVFETGPLAPLHKAIARMLGLSGSPAQYTFLPPTVPVEGKFARDTVYFFGWLFRNPEGFARYRKELIERFGPTAREEAKIKDVLASLPAGRTIIGVHMRLKTFPYFPDGEFLVLPARVRGIVDEYLRERGLAANQVALVLAADLPVPDAFGGFATYASGHDERTNFFILSKCSAIIGTNTTFSDLAAWFGDVPHIVTTARPIDWEYYKGKVRYFENTYADFAFGMPGRG